MKLLKKRQPPVNGGRGGGGSGSSFYFGAKRGGRGPGARGGGYNSQFGDLYNSAAVEDLGDGQDDVSTVSTVGGGGLGREGGVNEDMSKFYGFWQTKEWCPPSASGGKVPKNDRGNVEVPPLAAALPTGTVRELTFNI